MPGDAQDGALAAAVPVPATGGQTAQPGGEQRQSAGPEAFLPAQHAGTLFFVFLLLVFVLTISLYRIGKNELARARHDGVSAREQQQ